MSTTAEQIEPHRPAVPAAHPADDASKDHTLARPSTRSAATSSNATIDGLPSRPTRSTHRKGSVTTISSSLSSTTPSAKGFPDPIRLTALVLGQPPSKAMLLTLPAHPPPAVSTLLELVAARSRIPEPAIHLHKVLPVHDDAVLPRLLSPTDPRLKPAAVRQYLGARGKSFFGDPEEVGAGFLGGAAVWLRNPLEALEMSFPAAEQVGAATGTLDLLITVDPSGLEVGGHVLAELPPEYSANAGGPSNPQTIEANAGSSTLVNSATDASRLRLDPIGVSDTSIRSAPSASSLLSVPEPILAYDEKLDPSLAMFSSETVVATRSADDVAAVLATQAVKLASPDAEGKDAKGELDRFGDEELAGTSRETGFLVSGKEGGRLFERIGVPAAAVTSGVLWGNEKALVWADGGQYRRQYAENDTMGPNSPNALVEVALAPPTLPASSAPTSPPPPQHPSADDLHGSVRTAATEVTAVALPDPSPRAAKDQEAASEGGTPRPHRLAAGKLRVLFVVGAVAMALLVGAFAAVLGLFLARERGKSGSDASSSSGAFSFSPPSPGIPSPTSQPTLLKLFQLRHLGHGTCCQFVPGFDGLVLVDCETRPDERTSRQLWTETTSGVGVAVWRMLSGVEEVCLSRVQPCDPNKEEQRMHYNQTSKTVSNGEWCMIANTSNRTLLAIRNLDSGCNGTIAEQFERVYTTSTAETLVSGKESG
ncbi:hypothetical protein HDU96_008220 [Phlyctochytrium bullatum]|nr:hypothetical protein HDU96_008220 [Phlyctochytrium bullatum]